MIRIYQNLSKIIIAIAIIILSACTKTGLVTQAYDQQKVASNDGIHVVDGYLSFDSDDILKNYVTALSDDVSGTDTRASQKKTIPGFTSIADLEERNARTRAANGDNDDDDGEMTQDEYKCYAGGGFAI